MNITIKTESYNSRRFSKPWIAKVTLSANDLHFEWGNWIGEHKMYDNSGMLLLNNVEAGEYYAEGQKDGFGNKGHTAYYKLLEDGTGEKMTKLAVVQALSNVD